jgi:metal-dependent amidase/aminoacylase/carboxypeptidase family protein
MKSKPKQFFLLTLLQISSLPSFSQKNNYAELINLKAGLIEQKVMAWRQQIHQNPELGNREFKTAELIAQHLKALNIEVKTQVGHTGVVGVF